MVHHKISDEQIKGIELIFIELPKFKVKTFTEKKLSNLWLRFLTEIDENTTEVSEDLYSEKEIKEALEHLKVSVFTKEQLEYYEKYRNWVRIEKTAIQDAVSKVTKKMEEARKMKKKQYSGWPKP